MCSAPLYIFNFLYYSLGRNPIANCVSFKRVQGAAYWDYNYPTTSTNDAEEG